MTQRQFTELDNLIIGLNQALETVFSSKQSATHRAYPGTKTSDGNLSDSQKKHAAGLMRVNHVGEVCAQALYQSQALTARDQSVREHMQDAAEEENDHLAWCEQRLEELDSRKSYLNPLWYAGSFALGTVAGTIGDKWNLGFVAETEKQVVEHLQNHLGQLPEEDHVSRRIVDQMQQDEARHAEQAIEAGAQELPDPVKKMMKAASSIMTRTAYWV